MNNYWYKNIKAEPSGQGSSSSSTNSSAPSTAPTPSTNPQPQRPAQNNLFGLPSFGAGGDLLSNLNMSGFGSSNFAEVQSQMQQQMMSNPDMFRQMLDNPMVQSLMSNPDVIRELMMSNPQMQSLIEVFNSI